MPLLTDACTSCPRLCRFFASWILLSEVSWLSSVKFLTGNWKAKELHSCCVHVKSCGTNLEGTFHGLVVLRHEAIYEEVNEELSNLKHHCNGDTEVEGYGTAQGGYVWSIWPLNEVMIISDFSFLHYIVRIYLVCRALSNCFDIKGCKVNLNFQQVACHACVPCGTRGKAIWIHSSCLERDICKLVCEFSWVYFNLILLRWPIWLSDWQLVDQFLTLKVTSAIPFAGIHLLDDCIHTVDIGPITCKVTWFCAISAHFSEYFSSYLSG